ncbi:MAG TPA: CoA transferase subunit A, partial [Dehalococcoidia bacterium]|nr:CoA transferase subunit A [Dehalococcoidia bacterium]
MTSAPENSPGDPTKQGKLYSSALAALEGISNDATVLVAGFAGCGIPQKLLRGLAESGVSGLTLICQGAWIQEPGDFTVADLVGSGQVKKMISPMPFHPVHGGAVKEQWESGELEIEIVSQGVLAERLRAGGAGIGGVFLPSSSGTRFAEGKEVRQYDGCEHVLELALKADFALLRAQAADTLGNMVYDG